MKKELNKSIAAGLLLTPLMLSIAPVEIQLQEEFTYNHETQVNAGPDGPEMAFKQSTGNTSTHNGTQTFDFGGNPSDSDSDTDADPWG